MFAYNRSVNNFGSVHITNVYNKTVIVNNNHVAFNGGAGGLASRPNAAEMAALNQHHVAPTAMQTQHEHTAGTTRENFASVNHGAPAVAATAHPGQFSGAGVVGAHGSPGAAGGLAHGPGAVGGANANAVRTGTPGAANPNAAHPPERLARRTPTPRVAPGAAAPVTGAAAMHPNNPTANASLHPMTPARRAAGARCHTSARYCFSAAHRRAAAADGCYAAADGCCAASGGACRPCACAHRKARASPGMSDSGRGVEIAATSAGQQGERVRESGRVRFLPPRARLPAR